MTALLSLLEAWTAGWARSRGTPTPQPRPYGFELQVGLPGHVARHVIAAFDCDATRELALAIGQPAIQLKICAPERQVADALPAGWQVTAVNTLMSVPLDTVLTPLPTPEGFLVSEVEIGGATRSIVVHAGDVVAASGRIGLHGSHATFDQIETAPEFQRRGLGRLVMRELTERAMRAGATHGVLSATDAGLALYTAIGWRIDTPLTTIEMAT